MPWTFLCRYPFLPLFRSSSREMVETEQPIRAVELSGTVLNAKPTQTALTAPANIPASVWAILTDEQKAHLTKTGH